MYLKNVKIMYCVTGTGKTRALIGAISEIVHTTGKCVLVFANSIAACDEITEHCLSIKDIIPIFPTISGKIPKKTQPTSNFANETNAVDTQPIRVHPKKNQPYDALGSYESCGKYKKTQGKSTPNPTFDALRPYKPVQTSRKSRRNTKQTRNKTHRIEEDDEECDTFSNMNTSQPQHV